MSIYENYFCSTLIYVYILHSAIIGEIDDEADASLDMTNIRADPLNPVVYWFP